MLDPHDYNSTNLKFDKYFNVPSKKLGTQSLRFKFKLRLSDLDMVELKLKTQDLWSNIKLSQVNALALAVASTTWNSRIQTLNNLKKTCLNFKLF